MTGFHAAGRRVDLGLPEHIADDETREIYVRLGEISAERQRLERDDIVLDDQIAAAINAKPEGVAEALWAGEAVDESIDSDLDHIESLRGESARLQKRIAAQRDAERVGVNKLVQALDAAGPALAASNIDHLKIALVELSMVEEDLASVVAKHDTAAGLVHLLEERVTQGGALVLRHIIESPRVELTLALEHVRQGLTRLDAEIRAAEATLTPATGKKARKGRKAASGAHSAADVAAIGADGDD